MNLNVKYGLWMTMTWQCRLINCNKRIMLVPDADGGEAVHAWRGVVYGNSVLSTQFYC